MTANAPNVFSSPMIGIKEFAKNVHSVEPSPNETIDTDPARPLCLGNHIINAFTGDKYPMPWPRPFKNPQPKMTNGRLARCIPPPVNAIPKKYKTEAINPAFPGFFSTIGPKNAAPIPKKNIDNENAYCAFCNVVLHASAI